MRAFQFFGNSGLGANHRNNGSSFDPRLHPVGFLAGRKPRKEILNKAAFLTCYRVEPLIFANRTLICLHEFSLQLMKTCEIRVAEQSSRFHGRAPNTFSRHRRTLITSNRSPANTTCFTGFLPLSLARFNQLRASAAPLWFDRPEDFGAMKGWK
jgi:hypothetical protein